MTGAQAVDYIHSRSWKGSVLGLSRVRELLDRMGNPQNKLKYIHIAGTNGKGSTAAMLDRILRAAGYRTGLFTSPYIHRFNERMRVSGEDIADDILGGVTGFVRTHAEAMADAPTEFELVTAVGFEFFARENCDIVVLEVGLGGALDSTNIIEAPELAVITNLGLDHTDVLGDSLAEVASAKAGIIKPGCTVVAYPGVPETDAVIMESCRMAGASLIRPDFSAIRAGARSAAGQSFRYKDMDNLTIGLLGRHQLNNASLAVEAALAMIGRGWRIGEDDIRRGLTAVRWPGRFELLSESPVFILDGAHNPQGIAALVENIEEYLPGQKPVILTGMLRDKDFEGMCRSFAHLASAFVCVTPESPRALPANELAAHLAQYGKPVFSALSIRAGVDEALRLAGTDGAVCAFGSLYMSGDIRACFGKGEG